MALTKSNLEQIPQRNKDLAFGYVKECEKKNKQVIPSMIKYLCLVYSNRNKDKFDVENSHQTFKSKGNSIEHNSEERTCEYHNCYLENVVSKGIHIWKFKCDSQSMLDLIGIRNVAESSRLTGIFFVGRDDMTVVGYGDVVGGCTISNASPFGQKCNDGDLIEMRLDFNNLTLNFKVNDNGYGKAFNINPGQYRAAIGVIANVKHHKYTLLSYQNIV